MNGYTKTFLVLLRLAIGWHLLFEGLSKLNTYSAEAPPRYPRQVVQGTVYGGPTGHPERALPPLKGGQPKKPWSSEAYLPRTGPLAGFFHWMAGDPLLDRVEVLPAEDGEPKDKLYRRLPDGLEKDWRAYFDAFVDHYEIKGKELEQLETVLKQRKEATVRWLLTGLIKETKTPVAGNAPIDKEVTIPERVRAYKDQVALVRELEGIDRRTTLRPNLDTEVAEARADLARLRAELQNGVDTQTAEMKAALQTTITPKQNDDFGPLPGPITRSWTDWGRLDWIDFLTRWGLTVVGVLLLAGLFTRTACVGGAIFLLMFFLAMPPFPGLPDNPHAEGHYLYINKNIIEMLALLALAGTRSGRWLGLDGLVQFLAPSRWRRTGGERAQAVETIDENHLKEPSDGH